MALEHEARERLIHEVIGAMIEVHRQLGPGFLEQVYHRALEVELASRGIDFESEKEIHLYYKGKPIGCHKLDLFIENELVAELKAVEELHSQHYAQVRSYLKAVERAIGLLANFSAFPLDCRRVEPMK
jgi:GxxExxY protein